MREALSGWRGRGSLVVLSFAAALLPATAYAHHSVEFSASGFLAGLLHPWTGLDHVMAMLAVGLWATLMPDQSKRALLGATAVGIGAGAILGSYPGILSFGEQLTVVSVIAFGLFAAFAGRARTPLAALVVALFCLCHGHVQTAETPVQASHLAFSGGFLISMLALQLLGTAIGASLSKSGMLARSAGAGFSVLGLVLLLS